MNYQQAMHAASAVNQERSSALDLPRNQRANLRRRATLLEQSARPNRVLAFHVFGTNCQFASGIVRVTEYDDQIVATIARHNGTRIYQHVTPASVRRLQKLSVADFVKRWGHAPRDQRIYSGTMNESFMCEVRQ